MAINIFQGGKSSGKQPNSAANSTRAEAAKSALAVPAEASASGNVAVGKQGTLAKVGNVVGNIAGIASKFLPGVGGIVAKGLSNVLNDPEWWQSVPGEGLTLNQPLRPLFIGEGYEIRPAITEIVTSRTVEASEVVLEPTEAMITQYLMPQIRKVVNAIPLQTAEAYRTVIQVNATLYALWRQLKKFRFMMGHGQTYIANMNDEAFPYFQTENSARLDAAINRIEEYLRANVRLPHTLCEYLAWRYGRVYKSRNSAKASLQMYNVLSIQTSPSDTEAYIAALMNLISASAALQAANTDMYNAYYDHDLIVEIKDDTQYMFDPKEFALRTNCDVVSDDIATKLVENPNPVYLDSNLDNPTAFMASTISTVGRDFNGDPEWLVPAREIIAFTPAFKVENSLVIGLAIGEDTTGDDPASVAWTRAGSTSEWLKISLTPVITAGDVSSDTSYRRFWTKVAAATAVDLYNKDYNAYLTLYYSDGSNTQKYVDVTAPAFDLAAVPDLTIGQEHVYAFANLVDIARKHSMSYKQAEKLVTKEAANLVDSLDVAAVASPKPAATT